MCTTKKTTRGFTIIEVLIVLAVGSLILAVLFFAVPQLQRNQRDNQRRGVAARLNAELEAYASNNEGTYPFRGPGVGLGGNYHRCQTVTASYGCNDWLTGYINGKLKITDPTTGSDTAIWIGWDDGTRIPGTPAVANRLGNLFIAVNDRCDGEKIVHPPGGKAGSENSTDYALMVRLDREDTFYCIDSR